MTYLVERLVELKRHIDHLRAIGPQVTSAAELDRNLSLHNDVLFSLLTVCQLVIDISGDLSARRGDRFEDYTEAVRNLRKDDRFPTQLVDHLSQLPGFRNVLVYEYVALDLDRVIEALRSLEPIEEFLNIVRGIVSESQ